MKIIITGASGFIGRNLTLSMPETWDVFAVYNQSKDFVDFNETNKLSHVKALQCDLIDIQQNKSLADQHGPFDACVYLAANGDPAFSVKDPICDLHQNTVGLVNFLHHNKIKRFIYFSSGAVYDKISGDVSPATPVDPVLPYAISKLASEQYIKYFAKKGSIQEYVILRFFGAFGPYEPERKIYTKLVKTFSKENKDTFTVRGDGKNLIDAMYIDDAIDGIMKVLKSDKSNRIVDFCSGNQLSINELVERAARTFKKDPVTIINEGVVPEYIDFKASPKEMETIYGFKPSITLEQGLLSLDEFLA